MHPFRTRHPIRNLSACCVAVVLLLSASVAYAQDDDDELFLDDVEDAFGGEGEVKEKSAAYHWAFEVPADLLVLRPIAMTDTAIGFMLFSGISQFQMVGSLFGAVGNWLQDGEWFVDQAPMQQAWQQCVADPFDYFANRPLGQLTTD